MRYPWLLFISFTAVSLLPAAINITGFDTLTNDRFADDASFVADGFDLSGVAYNGTGPGNSGWLTMISPNVYITAEHAKPSIGSSATFYASNDPNGASLTRQVTSNRLQIGTTDIFVGTLSAPLTGSYASYSFASEVISNNNTATTGPPQNQANAQSFINSPYAGLNAYLLGRSPTAWSTSQDIAVGRNVLDRFQAGVTVTGANQGDFIGGTIGGINAVPFEAQLAVGDSGGPLMVDDGNGGLTIVGLNWFISTASDPDFFGTSYVGNYANDIQSFIDANPVPEPGQAALLFGLLGLAATLTRRSR